MMNPHQSGFFLTMLFTLLCCGSALGQQSAEAKKASSLDGPAGLFTVWDAEPLLPGEVNFSLGANHYHRDPGELSIVTYPLSASVGVFRNFELFGVWDVQKHIEASGIQTYRTIPGQLPMPATTRLGGVSFTSEALFMDVPEASGRSDLRGGAKYAFLSEESGEPFGLAGVFMGTLQTNNSETGQKRGLSSSLLKGGFGALVSKRVQRRATIYGNFLVNLVRSPRDRPEEFHVDIGHEFIYRAGAAFPVRGILELMVELDAKVYAGDRDAGLNPQDPVDFIVGLRMYSKNGFSIGAGYRASLNHIDEDPANLVFKSGTNGFVVQVAFGIRRTRP
jgi:hypothetical protein